MRQSTFLNKQSQLKQSLVVENSDFKKITKLWKIQNFWSSATSYNSMRKSVARVSGLVTQFHMECFRRTGMRITHYFYVISILFNEFFIITSQVMHWFCHRGITSVRLIVYTLEQFTPNFIERYTKSLFKWLHIRLFLWSNSKSSNTFILCTSLNVDSR